MGMSKTKVLDKSKISPDDGATRKVIIIQPLGKMNICTKFDASPDDCRTNRVDCSSSLEG